MAKKGSKPSGAAAKNVNANGRSAAAPGKTATKRNRFQSFFTSLFVGLLAVAAALVLYRWAGERAEERFDEFGGRGYPFALRDLPGRGKGLIATRPIKAGERIITEAPLFALSTQVKAAPETILADALAKLGEEERRRYMRLGNARLHADPRVSIFQTNAVALGSRGAGVCPTFARLNHACLGAFNVVYSWQEENGVIVVHAVRDIQPGEELLTTYTDTLRPRAERRQYLQQTYNFTCACAACTRPEAELAASDGRMLEHQQLMDRFASWARGAVDGREATVVGRRIWQLRYDDERYASTKGQLLADLAQIAAAHSNHDATLQWVEGAAKFFKIELGGDSQRFKEMVQVLTFGPQSHPHWGTRAKEEIQGPGYGAF